MKKTTLLEFIYYYIQKNLVIINKYRINKLNLKKTNLIYGCNCIKCARMNEWCMCRLNYKI